MMGLTRLISIIGGKLIFKDGGDITNVLAVVIGFPLACGISMILLRIVNELQEINKNLKKQNKVK